MVLPIELRHHWYDWDKGYLGTNPGWYEHVIPNGSTQKIKEVVLWLYEKIDNPERHCRWVRLENEIRVKFRHEKDYLWFSLSF